MRRLAFLALFSVAAPVGAFDLPTCQEIIDAKDAPSMRTKVKDYREAAFKSSAILAAQRSYNDLNAAGIKNAYQASVEQYESTFMVVREGAEKAWSDMEKQRGGLSATFIELCPERDTNVMMFYRDFYGVILGQYQEWLIKQQK